MMSQEEKKSTFHSIDIRYGSNAVRLTGRQWGVVAGILLASMGAIPAAWDRVEPFSPGADYRTPYELSEDYWQYARYARRMAAEDRILVIGDSVMWGEYVKPTGTLAHHLNARLGTDRFANLGVNGIHPAALAGLIQYYGRAISDRDVVLHYNPLWMSSPRHDLRTDKEFRFNHPKLVPQFWPKIPCYQDPNEARLSIVAERYLPLRPWINHVNQVYFGNQPLPAWASQNPYANPLRQVTFKLPEPDPARDRGPEPWFERGMEAQPFEWVDADDSFQWRCFQRTVETLQDRGNRVFVIVGPFNEHMIAPEGRPAYDAIKQAVAAWLDERDIPHLMVSLLPSELYGDASHPLDQGYAAIAEELANTPAFMPSIVRSPYGLASL